MKKITYLFFLIVCIACSNSNTHSVSQINDSIIQTSKEEKEDFYTFIEKFHEDSLFAFTRLADRISGSNSDVFEYDSIGNVYNDEYLWSNSEIQKELFFCKYQRKDKEFRTKYKIDGNYAEECIYIPNSSLQIFLKFQNKEDKWILVEYIYYDI